MERGNVINLEEDVGKTVGRRRPPDDPLEVSDGIQSYINEHFESAGHRLTPRGVYRFKTHEEADEWMRKSIRPKKD